VGYFRSSRKNFGIVPVGAAADPTKCSRLIEVESGFEFGGKLGDGVGDLGGLFAKGGHHAFGHLGFVADEFGGGEHEGQVIIDVMPHGGKLLVQFLDFLDS
jgi:hypothetical protein